MTARLLLGWTRLKRNSTATATIQQIPTSRCLTALANAVRVYPEEKPSFTPELDGDTEFERVLMEIPPDVQHMTKVAYIFNRHLEDLKFANIRAYNMIMDQLRKVAES